MNKFCIMSVGLLIFSFQSNAMHLFGMHAPRSRIIINKIIHQEPPCDLTTGGLAEKLSFRFDPIYFLKAEPDAETILEDMNNELDGKNTFIQQFVSYTETRDIENYLFRRALEANDPYARAVMYACFKNGLFGTKGMEILAELYKEGAHEETVKKMEQKFNITVPCVASKILKDDNVDFLKMVKRML